MNGESLTRPSYLDNLSLRKGDGRIRAVVDAIDWNNSVSHCEARVNN